MIQKCLFPWEKSGAGITGPNLAKRIVEVFLNTEFEGGRHARRVGQLDSIQP